MTAGVPDATRGPVPPATPAAASLALAPSLRAAPAPAAVLGVGPAAVWLGGAGGVVVLAAGDAVRLPNALVVAAPASRGPFAAVRPGEEALIGGGEVALSGLRVAAARWFDPHPALPAAAPARVEEALAAARAVVPPVGDEGLAEALSAGDDAAAVAAAGRLIGRGDGLTPMGDDVVAGTVAGVVLIGGATGGRRARACVDRIRPAVLTKASSATTSFSATLLRHGFCGEVAEPAGTLLLALAGRGDPAAAAAGLLSVGHSSGPALAAGVLAGAGAALERSLRWTT